MRSFTVPLLASILSVVAGSSHVQAGDPASKPAGTTDGMFIVHEWGTFTTFSGSDGAFLDFRPLAAEHSDLPGYVLDRGSYSQSRQFIKARLRGRVRMETPVTYFYTDRIRTVDVRVDFPEGLLTEFYPPVSSMLPKIDEKNIFSSGEALGKSQLTWNNVDLIPTDQLLPKRGGDPNQARLQSRIIHQLLPHALNEQHYSAARETDSALVHVREKVGSSPAQLNYFERFLFYRGVGKFQLPIQAKFTADEVVVSNDGPLPINSAILVHVDGDQLHATKIDQVAAGESLHFDRLQPVTGRQLSDMVRQSLVAEGLYEKEAASMVKTWQQSWFTENGTRVLYMVPGPTTDELLPLYVTPAPQDSLRVLVGRMEIMSPEDEQRMEQAVAQSSTARKTHYAKALPKGEKRKPYQIPASIHDYGRMAEPALARVRKLSKDPAVRNEAQMLIAQYRQ